MTASIANLVAEPTTMTTMIDVSPEEMVEEETAAVEVPATVVAVFTVTKRTMSTSLILVEADILVIVVDVGTHLVKSASLATQVMAVSDCKLFIPISRLSFWLALMQFYCL